MSRKTTSDVYDIDKNTGALILGKNRLDDYATKFLSKYCSEALTNPMPIPISSLIEQMGLTIIEEPLSDNLDVFGCCVLLDGKIKVYDREIDQYISKAFKSGTIIIDPMSEEVYGNGSYRNTIMHEIIHWEKDRKYFQILELRNKKAVEDLFPIMCKRSEIFFEPSEGLRTKKNQIHWLEWQAHRLAPRILMPKEMFKCKALEIVKKNVKDNPEFCGNDLINELSDFFEVSKVSAKYRIIEVGIVNELRKYIDTDYFEVKDVETNDYIKLSVVEAYQMIQNNQNLGLWIGKGKYIFADGYFVLANSAYIKFVDGNFELTKKGKRNLAKCAVNIKEYKYSDYEDYYIDAGYAYLLKHEGVDKRILAFHPSYQGKIPDNENEEDAYREFCNSVFTEDIDNEEVELARMAGDPTISLCKCLWYLMKNRNITNPSIFENATNLHKNYHGKIKNNNYNNMEADTLFALCIGLKLNFRTIEALFQKAEKAKLNNFMEPHKTYRQIIETMPGLSIDDFNNILEFRGIQPLGTKLREK